MPNRDPDDGFAPRYEIELLFAGQPPLLGAGALRAALAEHAPEHVVVEETDGDATSLRLRSERDAHRDARWRVVAPGEPLDAEMLAQAAQQTWWWHEGREQLAVCKSSIVLADEGAEALEYRERLELLHRLLVALIETWPCRALHWRPTRQLVDPRELVETMLHDAYGNPLPGALNVRFFRIDSADSEEMLMDTLGLAALGLPDLQCHFHGLDPADVSRVLYSTACHLYDHGPVITSGDSVQGPQPQDRWTSRLEHAIAEPQRPVLDLDPGFPFTAGLDEEDYVLRPVGSD